MSVVGIMLIISRNQVIIPKRFKIKFELKGYNLNEDEQDKVTGGCAAKKTSEDDGWVSALAVIWDMLGLVCL